MIRSEHYALLEAALEAKGVRLRTNADQYRIAHELPGWYSHFRGHTAATVWSADPGTEGLSELVKDLPPGPGVIKTG